MKRKRPPILFVPERRKRRRLAGRVVTWVWAPFKNSARDDSLTLHHWQPVLNRITVPPPRSSTVPPPSISTPIASVVPHRLTDPSLLPTDRRDSAYAIFGEKKIRVFRYNDDEYRNTIQNLPSSCGEGDERSLIPRRPAQSSIPPSPFDEELESDLIAPDPSSAKKPKATLRPSVPPLPPPPPPPPSLLTDSSPPNASTNPRWSPHLPRWTRSQTDELFRLCALFELRFAVIQDRLSFRRSLEGIKARYFDVSTALLERRSSRFAKGEERAKLHVLKRQPYNVPEAVERKKKLVAIYDRSPRFDLQEKQLVGELERVQEELRGIRKELKISRFEERKLGNPLIDLQDEEEEARGPGSEIAITDAEPTVPAGAPPRPPPPPPPRSRPILPHSAPVVNLPSLRIPSFTSQPSTFEEVMLDESARLSLRKVPHSTQSSVIPRSMLIKFGPHGRIVAALAPEPFRSRPGFDRFGLTPKPTVSTIRIHRSVGNTVEAAKRFVNRRERVRKRKERLGKMPAPAPGGVRKKGGQQ